MNYKNCQLIGHVFFAFFLQVGPVPDVISQKNETLSAQPWRIQDTNDGSLNFYSLPASFKKSILYTNDGAVVAVQYDKEKWGVVYINQQGKIIWEAPINAPIAGISKRDGNILVFFSDVREHNAAGNYFLHNYGNSGFIQTISATLLDGLTGKTIRQKKIFDNDQVVYIDPKIFTGSDGSFAGLLVRVSNSEKNRTDPDKELKERLTSSKLLFLELESDLTVKSKDIKAEGKEGFFLGAQSGKNNDFFFCSILKDQIIVERFRQSGEPSDKLSIPVSIRNFNVLIEPVTIIDPINAENVLLGLHYRGKGIGITNQVFEFNFSTKKAVGSKEDELNKAYKKGLEISEIKSLQQGSWLNMDALRIIDIVATKDRIAVVKEIRFVDYDGSNASSKWFRNDGLVVLIYDRQWQLLQTIALDKKNQTSLPIAASIGIHEKDGKLHFLMAAVDGVASYATVYAVIDLNSPKLEDFRVLDREQMLTKSDAIEGGATLWFPGNIFIHYLDVKGGLLRIKDIDSKWQRQNL